MEMKRDLHSTFCTACSFFLFIFSNIRCVWSEKICERLCERRQFSLYRTHPARGRNGDLTRGRGHILRWSVSSLLLTRQDCYWLVTRVQRQRRERERESMSACVCVCVFSCGSICIPMYHIHTRNHYFFTSILFPIFFLSLFGNFGKNKIFLSLLNSGRLTSFKTQTIRWTASFPENLI